MRGIHRSSVNSPHKGQWRRALMFSLICTRINGWVNNREAGDLRRHRTHYDVIVMIGRGSRENGISQLGRALHHTCNVFFNCLRVISLDSSNCIENLTSHVIWENRQRKRPRPDHPDASMIFKFNGSYLKLMFYNPFYSLHDAAVCWSRAYEFIKRVTNAVCSANSITWEVPTLYFLNSF